MSAKATLTLVAAMALVLFMVPTNSFANDRADADGPRLCSEVEFGDSFMCFKLTNPGDKTFAFMAPHLAKRAGMSEEAFLDLNNWDEEYLAHPIEPGVSYLYLVPSEAFVASNQ